MQMRRSTVYSRECPRSDPSMRDSSLLLKLMFKRIVSKKRMSRWTMVTFRSPMNWINWCRLTHAKLPNQQVQRRTKKTQHTWSTKTSQTCSKWSIDKVLLSKTKPHRSKSTLQLDRKPVLHFSLKICLVWLTGTRRISMRSTRFSTKSIATEKNWSRCSSTRVQSKRDLDLLSMWLNGKLSKI